MEGGSNRDYWMIYLILGNKDNSEFSFTNFSLALNEPKDRP